MNDAVTPAACANCGEPFASPPPAFCPACGQESRVRAPTLGEFVQQFGGAYFSTEGALWRKLKFQLLKSGELTCQYVAGSACRHPSCTCFGRRGPGSAWP